MLEFSCFGHRVVNYKKPKFDNSNRNSRMFRGTNPTGRRSEEGNNGARNNIVSYKCNEFGHIARNGGALINQLGPRFGNNAPVCQLCNNFGYIARFYKMDMRNNIRNPNSRMNMNKNERRNNSNSNSQKNVVKEHAKEFKEVFFKAKDVENTTKSLLNRLEPTNQKRKRENI